MIVAKPWLKWRKTRLVEDASEFSHSVYAAHSTKADMEILALSEAIFVPLCDRMKACSRQSRS